MTRSELAAWCVSVTDLEIGQKIDTDAGPREITSLEVHRAPISGTQTITLMIDGYPHPIHLEPGQKLNIIT